MPHTFKSDIVQECYLRAAEARQIATAATDPFMKADFVALERRWLSLARRVRRAVTSAEKQEPLGVVAPAARLSSSRVDWPAQPSLDLAQNYFSRISWIVSIVLLPPLPVAILALFVHWDDVGAV